MSDELTVIKPDEIPVNHIESYGTFAGQPIRIICDGKCEKAWGINSRPELHRVGDDYRMLTEDELDNLYDNADFNIDDNCDLADHELGDAPIDPGTYEGGHGKPFHPIEHNKWCVRECERCRWGHPSEDLVLPDYNKRQYNCAPHERD